MYRHKKLFILVEGPSDKRFFSKVFKPEFETRYRRVHIRQYGEMKKELVIKLIDEIKADEDHYIYASAVFGRLIALNQCSQLLA